MVRKGWFELEWLAVDHKGLSAMRIHSSVILTVGCPPGARSSGGLHGDGEQHEGRPARRERRGQQWHHLRHAAQLHQARKEGEEDPSGIMPRSREELVGAGNAPVSQWVLDPCHCPAGPPRAWHGPAMMEVQLTVIPLHRKAGRHAC